VPYASGGAHRKDANQKEVVAALRKAGCSVTFLDIIDLIVGWRGFNFLFELKDPEKSPSKRRLTDREQKFFDTWNGSVFRIETAEEAIALMEEFIAFHDS
jgi:hypothetical protein